MSETTKPYMLLDVDGVLNVWPYPLDREGHVQIEVLGYPIWYQPAVIERINALADRVELRWLTTWRDRARDSLAPAVGLIDFPIVDHDIHQRDRHPRPLDWWKMDAAEDLLADTDRPVIWCDDDMDEHLQQEITRRYGADRLCLVQPRTTPGLTLEMLDVIEAFVDRFAEREKKDGE